MPYLKRDAQPDRLYYQLIAGDSSLPYLVFLHEGLGCCAMWADFPEKLCAMTGCPGLVYDRMGYGQSSALRQARTIHYLHDYALNELKEVLASLVPDAPCILVGHSDGGSIALILGAERPPRLKGIITEAAHIYVEEMTIEGIKRTNQAWASGKLRGLTRYHGEKTAAIYEAWSGTWLAPWFSFWNIEYLLPSIEAPMLVIQGADDQYASSAHAARIGTRSGGDAQVEIVEGCAHVPHLEAQDAVLALMTGFIRRISA